jgi:hypothetical protein
VSESATEIAASQNARLTSPALTKRVSLSTIVQRLQQTQPEYPYQMEL